MAGGDVHFFMYAPNRPDTLPGALRQDHGGYMSLDAAFGGWQLYVPPSVRGPRSVLVELSGGVSAMMPHKSTFQDRVARFHPAMFEPLLREMGLYEAGRDKTQDAAVEFARKTARELDLRIAKFLDPRFDIGEVKPLARTAFCRPWHDLRGMTVARMCSAMGADPEDFLRDPASATIPASSRQPEHVRCAFLWSRARMDGVMAQHCPPKTPDGGDEGQNDLRALMHGGQNETQLMPFTLICDNSGKSLLAAYDDGFVWVGTMLNTFDKRHARFMANAENRRYMDEVCRELGMFDPDGRPDHSKLFKQVPSPFDPGSVRGTAAHIEMLTKYAGWVYTPYERLCHKVVLRFYTGQLTSSDCRAAAEIGRRLGINVPGADGALERPARTHAASASAARQELARVQNDLISHQRTSGRVAGELEDVKQQLEDAKRELAEVNNKVQSVARAISDLMHQRANVMHALEDVVRTLNLGQDAAVMGVMGMMRALGDHMWQTLLIIRPQWRS